MTNAQHSTNDAPATATSPFAPLWRMALTEFEAANAAFVEYEVRYQAVQDECDKNPPAEDGREHPILKMERDEGDPVCDRVTDARERLFRTPAPDKAAVAFKLHELNRYLAEVESEDAQRVAQVSADVARFLLIEGE